MLCCLVVLMCFLDCLVGRVFGRGTFWGVCCNMEFRVVWLIWWFFVL